MLFKRRKCGNKLLHDIKKDKKSTLITKGKNRSYRRMFSAFVVKIVIFLIWRIWNRWRPFVRKNRVWVHHWLLLLICRHNQFSIYFTNILKYFLGILHKRYFLWKCEKHSHFSFRPPCYRHPVAEIPKPRIKKCKWPDWDCAQSLKGWPIFQFWCKLVVKVFRENLHILSPVYA